MPDDSESRLAQTITCKTVLRLMLALVAMSMLFTGVVAADDGPEGTEELEQTINNIATWMTSLLVLVAIITGIWAGFELLFNGGSVEKGEKGRARLRNTFIAIGLAALIRPAIDAFTYIVGVNDNGNNGGNGEGEDMMNTAGSLLDGVADASLSVLPMWSPESVIDFTASVWMSGIVHEIIHITAVYGMAALGM